MTNDNLSKSIFDVSDLEDNFLEDVIKDRTGMYERRKGTMDEEIHKQMLEFLVVVKLEHIKRISKERQRLKAEIVRFIDKLNDDTIGQYEDVFKELKKRLGII